MLLCEGAIDPGTAYRHTCAVRADGEAISVRFFYPDVEAMPVPAGHRFELLRLRITFHVTGGSLSFAPIATGHAKKLAERNVRFARIVER